jgi:predicted dinucleotide-binding enzyme
LPPLLCSVYTGKEHQMTIGIIGSGAIGAAFARTLARVGIQATISNSRGPDSLQELAHELGPWIKAGTREETARADTVFVAVNWTKLPAALAGLPDWNGRIVIDANNPIEAPLFKPVDLDGRVSSEVFADLVPGARVVKAFNHLRAEVLAGDPKADGACCSIPAMTTQQRQKSRHSSIGSALLASILDRSRSAASSLSFPAGHCRTRTSSRSADGTSETCGDDVCRSAC